jgi:signal transduction histidine kinase
MNDPMLASGPPSPGEVLDGVLLDAALWRAHRLLARHWLHALRGPLNAMSLSLVLLKPGVTDGGERSVQGVRGQIRELDAGLARLLDHSWLDESPQGRTDVAAILAHLSALLEPLARRRQAHLEIAWPDALPTAEMDARALHGMLLVLLTDAVERSDAQSVVRLTAGPEPGERLRIDIDAPVRGGRPSLLPEGTFAALQRIGARAGAALDTEGEEAGGRLCLTVPASQPDYSRTR